MAAQIENFVKYPPRQKAASFNLDSVMASLGPAQAAATAAKRKAPSCEAARTRCNEVTNNLSKGRSTRPPFRQEFVTDKYIPDAG